MAVRLYELTDDDMPTIMLVGSRAVAGLTYDPRLVPTTTLPVRNRPVSSWVTA